MKTQQTTLSEVRLVYRTKVKASERLQVKCSKDAIKANASGIIICHNHSSGNIQPGESDLTITRKIKESVNVMDIQLLDHFIIVPGGMYFSIGDEGII